MKKGPGAVALALVLSFGGLFVQVHSAVQAPPEITELNLKEHLAQRHSDIEDALLSLKENLSLLERSFSSESEGLKKSSRRRRRRGSTGGSKGRRRRRRRRRRSGTKPAPKPAATKADASPRKIEAGWGDLGKRGDFFTVFVIGSGFDTNKDRIIVVHGNDQCGSSSARLAQTTGRGNSPPDFNGWKNLPCNAVGASDSKLACGDGESSGVKFPDDNWVDTYEFKVCVCDFSKRNRCNSKSDFDVTPSSPTLPIQSVV